jgi:hypothetical protein
MSNVAFTRIPIYTAELLSAAKSVLAGIPGAMEHLEQAVIEFERQMPLRDGEMQVA